MPRSRSTLAVAAGLVAMTLAAYVPLWRNDFIDYDDESYITDNPGVLEGLTPAGIVWAWTTGHGGFWFPLTWMSLQVDASLSGPRGPCPQIFHGQNLLWHVATVVLLFATLRRMTGSVWRSSLVAALFAVHPLHVESVAWATERKDVLSGFFWVLTMYAYVRYAERPGWGRYLGVMAAMSLGLLAKPMLVTLPCALLLLDVWPLGRWDRGPRPARPADSAGGPLRVAPASGGWLLLEKLPLLAVGIVASAVTMVAQRSSSGVVPMGEISLAARLANAVISYGWYLQKTVWPTGLTVFYVHPRDDWDRMTLVGAVMLLASVTLAACLAARRMPCLLVGWLWFLGTLVPVIGLVQSGEQARADRFVYVPHIGLFAGLVWAAFAVMDRLRVPMPARATLAAVCLVCMSWGTWWQLGHWRDAETVWRHALAVDADNDRAHTNLAAVLVARARRSEDGRQARDLLAEARRHYEAATVSRPRVAANHYNLGMTLFQQGELEPAAEALEAAARLDAGDADTWHVLGVVRLRQGRGPDAERAFRRALEIAPTAADTIARLGTALWSQGRRAEAVTAWEAAVRLAPDEPEARRGLDVARRQGSGADMGTIGPPATASPKRPDPPGDRGIAPAIPRAD